MTTIIPKTWKYNVTDADGNIIRTINNKYWKRNNCRLNVHTYSDSDKVDISIDIDSDFNISIPVVPNISEPRRFNVEPLKLKMANHTFSDEYEVRDFTADVELAAEAMKEFQEILDFIDYLDCEQNEKAEEDKDPTDSTDPVEAADSVEATQYHAPRAPIFDADDVEAGLKGCLTTGLYPNGDKLEEDQRKAIGSILNLKDGPKQEYLVNRLRAAWGYKNSKDIDDSFIKDNTALDIAVTFAINDMIFMLDNN